MLFCSREFALFFAAVFVLYWAVPLPRARVWGLVAASIVFYASWSRWLALVVCASTTFDYAIARGMEHSRSPRVRSALLAASIAANLALLSTFKYADLALESLTGGLRAIGVHASATTLGLVAPIGISFYTFEAISYTVDVHRRRLRAERNLGNLLLFILFFPHLVAGPIVRARHFLPQIRRPKRWSWSRGELGLRYWIVGVAKKLVIADRLAWYVDPVFADPSGYATHVLWLAAFAYAVQLYCDFSGYSDMAIGSAHLLGYKLPRNFDLPYAARGPAELWRRWHISLSTWLRDYLYVPLGGNAGGKTATYRNLMVTMTLGGLWHGAGGRFLVWGFLHGMLLVVERELRALGRRLGIGETAASARWLGVLGVVATFVAWSVLLVLFRSPSLAHALAMLARMAIPARGGSSPIHEINLWLCFALVAAAHAAASLAPRRAGFSDRAVLIGAGYAAAASLVLFFSADAGRAFIYFQF